MYTIGQAAEMFGLPISTIRYYDREGLFPGMERQGGKRVFGEREIEALRVIECLKASGLGIRDIRLFMAWTTEGAATYAQRKQLFEARRKAVEAEMAALEKTLAMLRYKCWYYETAMADGSEERICAMLPDRLPPGIQALYDRVHGQAPGEDAARALPEPGEHA